MAGSLPDLSRSRHRLLPETSGAMAKADLRKPEVTVWKTQIGAAIERCRTLTQHSLKTFADAIGRDERQVKRWITGDERPQFDAIFAVPELRAAFVIALAEMAEGVEVLTTIRIRRSA